MLYRCLEKEIVLITQLILLFFIYMISFSFLMIYSIIIITICNIYYKYDFNCIDNNICLKNLTISHTNTNYRKFICKNINSINLPFNPNRKISSNPKFIVATIYMYPSINKFYKYVQFIKAFSLANTRELLLLISVNISLYNSLITTQNIKKIKKNRMIEKLDKLDNGYSVFKYTNNRSYCYIIYTQIIQKYFSNDFIISRHYTKNYRKYPFSGYYAASTNLYSVLPFLLKIFDYFDYYFKYDFDKLGYINIKNFAFGNYKENKWYLFGTCISEDSKFVCSNVKQMILDYVVMRNCSENIISAIQILTNECIQFPGWFTGMWLGLYSSQEMKDFSNYYVGYSKGIKYYRWGDQQFFLNSLLLFSGRNRIHSNLSYNCVIKDKT